MKNDSEYENSGTLNLGNQVTSSSMVTVQNCTDFIVAIEDKRASA